jgi:RNA polymerase sigma-70 factor, ECF subfamily
MANPNNLLERLQRGDEQALADLVDIYGAKIYQLAFRYLRNKEDAEEVAQDVLFKVHRKVGEFRGDSALSSWIYRITFNTAMSRLRSGEYKRLQEEQRLAALNEHKEEQPRPVPEPVLALPAIYRAPVMLRDVQGMSTEEASAMLKVKDQTLKSRLHRGRLILRKQLADFAGGLSLHRPIYGT